MNLNVSNEVLTKWYGYTQAINYHIANQLSIELHARSRFITMKKFTYDILKLFTYIVKCTVEQYDLQCDIQVILYKF